jgi:C4-dicarboxylate-specific signal transduction histidine kinase
MLASALDEIVEQSARASEIVKRVRAFINPKRRVYEEIAPESLVSHAVGLLQGELQRHGIALQIGLAPGLPRVRGDHVLLEQVLVNLIQNAIQAMQATPTALRGLEISALRLEAGVEIRVADRGPGIAEAVQGQLFSPFFSTKSDGLGLGLSICRSILEAHGGRISVANRAAGGAEFICLLPASLPALITPNSDQMP